MIIKPETTGVGSLPFTDFQDAMDHVFSSYSIPFYPQLPKHPLFKNSPAAQMLQEVVPANILAKIVGNPKPDLGNIENDWNTDLTQFPGIDLFKKFLKNSGSRLFKLQLAGPGTALAALEFYTGRTFETGFVSLLRKKIVAQAKHLINYLRIKDQTCIFLWDELLVHPGLESSLADLFQIEAPGAVITGVHNCASLKLEVFVAHSDHRYLSADFSRFSLEEPANVQALRKIVGLGGLIAGIVDTQKTSIEKSPVMGLWQKLANELDNTANHPEMPLMLSGGCGTGLHSVDYEISLAKLLSEIKQSS